MENNHMINVIKKYLYIFIILTLFSAFMLPIHALDDSISLTYSVHVQELGTQGSVSEGETSGTTGQNLRMEAFWVNLNNQTGISGSIQYKAYIRDKGWESDWHSSGEMSGTTGEARALEAILIRLTGDLANQYDVYYRTHVQNIGWMNWSSNGNPAGTVGYDLQLEAIQIKLTPRGAGNPDADPVSITNDSYRDGDNSLVEYTSHVQDIGTQQFVKDGAVSGTTGQGRRIEAFAVRKGSLLSDVSGDIQYRAHVQDIGWMDWTSGSVLAGTTGKALKAEAIQVQLTGDLANQYDVYYRAHVQNIGWMNWTSNGSPAGTEGRALRLEAIQIVLVSKGAGAPATNPANAVDKSYLNANDAWVEYTSHVQNIGTQNYVKDGALSGTTGQGLHMEAFAVRKGSISNDVSGDIQYRSYVKGSAWESNWHSDGDLSGTTGRCLPLEAVQIQLTGDLANKYDIWYQVHVSNIGWMGWTSNGSQAGIVGYNQRIEGIHIQLLAKGSAAPGSTNDAYRIKVTEGIDISEHNGDVDLTPYRNQFVIIRAGYGWSSDPSSVNVNNFPQVDKKLVENINKCERLGIPYGIYWYSYATNADEAWKEAETFYQVTRDYHPALGFWMDEEGDRWKTNHNNNYQNRDNITSIVSTFTSTMRNHGRNIGVYASYNWFESYIFTNDPRWVAHYGKVDNGNKNIDLSNYSHCVMHQYTSKPIDKDIMQVPASDLFR